ncbi:MAG: tetratricopeptide repeat protein [Calditrichia bacterium]
MADIGLNQNISIKNRKFHIQTATNIDDGTIRTEIFEQGRLLYASTFKYERRSNNDEEGGEQRIRYVLDDFHQSIISNIETFFEISQILKSKDHVLSHFRLGAIFLSLHIFDKAEEHLKQAVDIDPNFHSAYIALARCYFYQKKIQDAANILEVPVKADANYPDLYNMLGMVLLDQKNYIHALNHFRHAIRLNPKYKEAIFNIAAAIFKRIALLRSQKKTDEIKRNLEFLNVILSKIYKIGDEEDQSLVKQVKQAFSQKNFGKIQTLIFDYRNKLFYQKLAPEIVGYEFYLMLRHKPEILDKKILTLYQSKISKILAENADYPDMWNYRALIHLLLCRDYFLKGLENIKQATVINPNFKKAKSNLRLVENDGREFLSLIKAITK